MGRLRARFDSHWRVYASLDLAGRVAVAAKGRIRLAWLSGGAIAMGIGIWKCI